MTTYFNYKQKPGYETGASLTVPGQVLTLRQIRDRFQRGQQVEVFQPVYNPDFPPEFDKLSKIERIEMSRKVRADVALIQGELARKRKSDVVEPTLSKKDDDLTQQIE